MDSLMLKETDILGKSEILEGGNSPPICDANSDRGVLILCPEHQALS